MIKSETLKNYVNLRWCIKFSTTATKSKNIKQAIFLEIVKFMSEKNIYKKNMLYY